jgi:hypothetical protein
LIHRRSHADHEAALEAALFLDRFLPSDTDLRLITLAGGLVIVDQSCDAFDPVHARKHAFARQFLQTNLAGCTPA